MLAHSHRLVARNGASPGSRSRQMRGVLNRVPVRLPLAFLVAVVVASLLATAGMVKMKNSYPLEKQVTGLKVERKVPEVPEVSSRMMLELQGVRSKTPIEKDCWMLS